MANVKIETSAPVLRGVHGDRGLLLCVVGSGGCIPTAPGPVGMEKFSSRSVDAFVSMCAEVIALGLK